MQVISRRVLREFWRIHSESRGPLLAWHRLIGHGEHEDLSAIRHLFKSAYYQSPFVVFPVGGSGVRVVSVIHYSRRRVYVRHVFTRLEYEVWYRRTQREDVVRECFEDDAVVMGRGRLADVGIAVSRKAVRHHKRAALQSHERFLE